MTATLANFTSETQLGVTDSQLVSTSTSETKFIGKATVTNTSTSNVEVTIWRILTATTATEGSGGNWLIRETIPAGRTVPLTKLMQHVLGPTMAIKAKADTASVVNIDISGTTEA